MKKLLILPLLVGMFLFCSGATFHTSEANLQYSVSEIPQATLYQIFESILPELAATFGIETTVAQLQVGYEDGTISVGEIDSNVYQVEFGGGSLISDLSDYI